MKKLGFFFSFCASWTGKQQNAKFLNSMLCGFRHKVDKMSTLWNQFFRTPIFAENYCWTEQLHRYLNRTAIGREGTTVCIVRVLFRGTVNAHPILVLKMSAFFAPQNVKNTQQCFMRTPSCDVGFGQEGTHHCAQNSDAQKNASESIWNETERRNECQPATHNPCAPPSETIALGSFVE